MPTPQDHISMALFCDFENVALGVRDAQYDKFDIKRVLERLLLKGSIVVKKAYCDWDRYRNFKAPMHEANFELIEIPHVRQSGKNSADIRLVVDALDLCYTKSHVNTFVIISGDSDFSPLVSKLRENAKHVIGVGVKQSTSDLLIANCDEFIFYDDLVRESQRNAARRDPRDAQPQQRRSPEEEKRRREEMEARRAKIIEQAVETYEALVTDRDEGGRIWASVLKEALKRRNPGFNESYYGFKTFGNLLEEAQSRGLLEFGRDEKSGTYVFRGSGVARAEALAATVAAEAPPARAPQAPQPRDEAAAEPAGHGVAPDRQEAGGRRGGRGRGGRGRQGHGAMAPATAAQADDAANATAEAGTEAGKGATAESADTPAVPAAPPAPRAEISPVAAEPQTSGDTTPARSGAKPPAKKAARKTTAKTAGKTAAAGARAPRAAKKAARKTSGENSGENSGEGGAEG